MEMIFSLALAVKNYIYGMKKNIIPSNYFRDGHIPKLNVYNTLLRQIMVGQGVHLDFLLTIES